MPTTEQIANILKPRKRAIIYCRVSTDKQSQDGESLEYQEEKCRQYAKLHDMDVIMPALLETKSGFIHYSLREKLTLARQMIRDHVADVIIVWDLRRLSRNFVHSAMIFAEIEGVDGVIISVSEHIDDSPTGQLIRSIITWSAESERNKIVEYANRRWQTRIELGLPVGTGRGRYGWDWADEDKTVYVINPEEAAECCLLFERIDVLRATIEKEVEGAICAMLENTAGREQVNQLEQIIELAKAERTKYEEGSYMYSLISQDIISRQEQLARFQEEMGPAVIGKAVEHYHNRVMEFLNFLDIMHGSYEQATFQQKRNAIEVLGVRVMVRDYVPTTGLSENAKGVTDDKEWFTAKEAAPLLGVSPKTIHYHRRSGRITHYKYEPHLLIHWEELIKLQEKGFLQRNTADVVRQRVEITYSSRFNMSSVMDMPTGVSVSLNTRKYV